MLLKFSEVNGVKFLLTFWKVKSGKGGVQQSATRSSSNKQQRKQQQTTGKAVTNISGQGWVFQRTSTPKAVAKASQHTAKATATQQQEQQYTQ